ncbi:MAG TPA: tetratricopeptide repeat protein [Lentimicrobium sp.]|nr:tetratricopeptide repeat protein [Lentimicrobium sp.]
MTLYEIEQWHYKVVEFLRQQRVYEAIEFLSKNESERFRPSLDEIRYTYNNILIYTGKGINDPMGAHIYARLMGSLYELSDLMRLNFLANSGSRLSSIKADIDRRAIRENEDLTENLIGLSFDNELQEILRDASLFNDESESETATNHRQAISRAFYNLWLADKFSENDEQVVTSIFNGSSLPWFEKSMLVSSLILGLLRTFDVRRLSILIDLYKHPDNQISQRALFGILLTIFLYDKRISYYSTTYKKLLTLKEQPEFREDALNTIIQFNRSRDTEKVARKLQDEILPQVIKFNEELSEKLDLDKLLQTGDPIDKNPDWEKYFDSQPELTRKLEELTNMQLEGVDVFISAFAQLKSFTFFNDLPNWFLPFYPENYAVQQALNEETEEFKTGLLKGLDLSMYMCNSDKFSFAFNIRNMPSQQKNMMIQMFESEGEQLAELKNEELSDPVLARKRIIIQYIQDMYRFFKLHTLRNETGDIFSKRLEIQESSIFSEIIEDPEFFRTVANFHFDNDHYEEALKIYNYLIEKDENYAELYEKAGYCKQKLGMFNDAIVFYERADLFDTNHNWLLRKKAQCHMALGDIESALECYLELSQIEPENQRINAAIGSCYLQMEKPDQAIEYFYRIEFASPGTSTAMRPVAWCLFLLKRLTEADKYYTQLLETDPNSSDFLNAGHVAFALGQKEKAIQSYLNSIKSREDDIKSFVRSFNKDRKYLLANEVDLNEIALMLDYLRFGKRDGIYI